MNNYLYFYIIDFFSRYLPEQRGYSNNTIISYKYTFILLIEFMKEKHHFKTSKISVDKLNKDIILEFIDYLSSDRRNSIATTNQRLCAIHSFCKYLQKKDIIFFENTSEILNIETKKKRENEMYYLTKEEIKNFFKIFDISDIKQFRDYTLLSLLYDSGARVRELINLESKDINFSNNTVRIYGKGNKIRIVPISSEVIKILKKYFEVFQIDKNSNKLLFFNSRKNKLTKEGIKYIIQKYAKLANLNFSKITPHTFRHTKAMHLLENDVNLVYIRDFLGHVSITTTEIYAKANPESKRKAIEDLSNEIIDHKKYNDNDKDELLNWLRDTL